jgi:uncharacterized protein (DUF927 family)
MHNDGLLILDELSQVDPREAGEAAYMLANEQGKTRASRVGTARAAASWRLLFLSAGEESLASLMARAGRKPTVGQEIRLAEIESDAGAGMGIVEQLHTYKTSEDLIRSLRNNARQYYGTVGVEYITRLVEDLNRLASTVPDSIQQFIAACVAQSAGGQVERVARRFALVGIAGELATEYGLTSWPPGEATRAAQACFASWLNLFGGKGNREEQQLLEQVKAFFETNGASRFQYINDAENTRIINRAGYYRLVEFKSAKFSRTPIPNQDGQREYLVFSAVFRQELCKGFPLQFAINILKKHKWLVSGKDQASQSLRLPELGMTRVYVFGPRMWSEETDGAAGNAKSSAAAR